MDRKIVFEEVYSKTRKLVHTKNAIRVTLPASWVRPRE